MVRIDDIGIELENEGGGEFGIRDDDPLSARAELRRVNTVSRGEWRVRTEFVMRFSASRDGFHVRAVLSAFDDAVLIRRREWDETIPRDLM